MCIRDHTHARYNYTLRGYLVRYEIGRPPVIDQKSENNGRPLLRPSIALPDIFEKQMFTDLDASRIQITMAVLRRGKKL